MDQGTGSSRTEVIVCHFGGPTQSSEVYPFLLKLFEDPFIIRGRIPAFFRRWLAQRIARKRAPKSDHEYAKIGYSPINRCTQIQADQLESLLLKINPHTKVHVVNRYTKPFASELVPRLNPKTSKIYVLTLYPHLCHSTTVSSLRDLDLAFEAHHGHRDFPSTRVFSWWHHPGYLNLTFDYLKEGLIAQLSKNGSPTPSVEVVFSAHGIPQPYHQRGDPYVTEIQGHFQALQSMAENWLNTYEGGRDKSRVHFHLSFQSKVGPVEWVKPYTEETIKALGAQHPKAGILMVPISFTSDHIETLYEMDHTYKNLALESGFSHYSRVRPAGEDPRLAACLRDILVNHGFGLNK